MPQVIISKRYFYFMSQYNTSLVFDQFVYLKRSVVDEIWGKSFLLSFVKVGSSLFSLTLGLTFLQFLLDIWQKHILVKLLFCKLRVL